VDRQTRRSLLLPLLVLLTTCKGEQPKVTHEQSAAGSTQAGCELAELSALGEALTQAEPSARVDLAWPGVREACRGLPAALASYFDAVYASKLDQAKAVRSDAPELRAVHEAVCPEFSAVGPAVAMVPPSSRARMLFEGCGLERYAVFELDELDPQSGGLMTWALHQWLLDQGLDAERARPLTRAIYGLEVHASAEIERVTGLRLPTMAGRALEAGPRIYLSASELRFGSERLMALDGGRIPPTELRNHELPALSERLGAVADGDQARAMVDDEPWAGRVLIVADRDTPYATLMDLMSTAGRVGYTRFAFVVRPSAGRLAQVGIAPPRSGPAAITIELSGAGLSLARASEGEAEAETHALDDLDAVAALAEAARADDPEARIATISATGEVTLEQLLAVIDAARGAGCDIDPGRCLLPEVVLMSSDGHSYGASVVLGGEAENPWAELEDEDPREAYGVRGIGLGGSRGRRGLR